MLESETPKNLRRADSPYLTIAALKDLGWTDGAIKEFLGEPDDLAPNPVYRSAPMMKRYLRERAEDAMSTAQWQAWYERSKERRQKLSKSLTAHNEAKRNLLISQAVENLETWFPCECPTPVEIVAYWHEQKTYFLSARGKDLDAMMLARPKPDDIDGDTLDRWLNNLLRHGYSNYDEVLEILSGQVGSEIAYHALRAEIDRRISGYLSKTA
jgi:hypothetical protein